MGTMMTWMYNVYIINNKVFKVRCKVWSYYDYVKKQENMYELYVLTL